MEAVVWDGGQTAPEGAVRIVCRKAEGTDFILIYCDAFGE